MLAREGELRRHCDFLRGCEWPQQRSLCSAARGRRSPRKRRFDLQPFYERANALEIFVARNDAPTEFARAVRQE